MPSLLAERAAAEPDRPALAILDQAARIGARLTFGEWDRRSRQLAEQLIQRGVRTGDRVGLVFTTTDWLDFAISFLGVLSAGGVAVPLGSDNGTTSTERLLRHCAVVGTIHSRGRPVSSPGWLADLDELPDRCHPSGAAAQPAS